MAKTGKNLTMDSLNPGVKKMEYAVRGPIVARAVALENELKSGETKPFDRVVKANIGDCHATGQKPITFIRQVLALVTYPELMKKDKFPADEFPTDVKQRAQRILDATRGQSIGSYSESPGLLRIREDIAAFIEKRDGFPTKPTNIFMCTGASDGIKTLLSMMITQEQGAGRAGIMIPVPQYPLYSAVIDEFCCQPIHYYLKEESNWSLDVEELERALKAAKPQCKPRALCVINPGNPTGQVLTEENIKDVIKFAYKNNLFLMADEVYQHNVYAEGMRFVSFKKVMMEMGAPYDAMELASFMSASKGFMGECGYRGGYSEIINLDPEVQAVYNKLISAKLCPPVSGQAVIECIVNPPQESEPSYPLFSQEKKAVLDSLKEKAKLVSETFDAIDGITCNPVQGAMYAFPRITLPPGAIEAAKKKGQTPDEFYCFALLDKTGICTVPGSGFGEKEGTYHFRITILPPVSELKAVLGHFKEFHQTFVAEYQ